MERMLKSVALHITPACDNDCDYCYMKSIRASNPNYKDFTPDYLKIEGILEKICDYKIENVLLVGGDPCKYPFLDKIVYHGHDLGLKIDIISNTLNLENKDIIDLINGFDTTILGKDSCSHDKIANREGAYEKLISNIKELCSHGSRVGIVLNATPENYYCLFDMVKNLIDHEKICSDFMRYVMVQRIIPNGFISDKFKYSLKKDQITPLFENIERIRSELGLKITFEDAFPLCAVNEDYHKYLSPCAWGYSRCSMNWNGDVSRCGADPSYKLGNIFENSLDEIWENSPILQSFRSVDWMPTECKACSSLSKCRCGCPLSATTNFDHKPDMLCPF